MNQFLRSVLSGRFARASSGWRKPVRKHPEDWETLERTLLRRIEARLSRARRRE